MSKKLGQLAEAEFMAKVLAMDYAVLNPWGDNEKFDFVLEKHGKFTRVQVKSTDVLDMKQSSEGRYNINSASGTKLKKLYCKKDVDVVAAYVRPHKVFYLIPVTKIRGTTIQLYPHRHNPAGYYEQFKGAWEVLANETADNS